MKCLSNRLGANCLGRLCQHLSFSVTIPSLSLSWEKRLYILCKKECSDLKDRAAAMRENANQQSEKQKEQGGMEGTREREGGNSDRKRSLLLNRHIFVCSQYSIPLSLLGEYMSVSSKRKKRRMKF